MEQIDLSNCTEIIYANCGNKMKVLLPPGYSFSGEDRDTILKPRVREGLEAKWYADRNISSNINIDNLESFEDDGGYYGFKDNETGKTVIEPTYSYAGDFDESGLAYVEIDGESAYINVEGKVIERIETYDDPDPDGYSIATYGDKCGIVHIEEEHNDIPFKSVVFPFIFDYVEELTGYKDDNDFYFSHGYIRINQDGKWGLHDGGEWVLPCIYDHIGTIEEYSDIFLQLEGKWGYGYIKDDRDLKKSTLSMSVPCLYDDMRWEYNGCLKVKYDGEEFYVDFLNSRIERNPNGRW